MWEALGEYQGPPLAKMVVRYLAARVRGRLMEHSYRTYVTDSLRLIPQMASLTVSWADLVDEEREPERTAEEIVDDVIARLEGAAQ